MSNHVAFAWSCPLLTTLMTRWPTSSTTRWDSWVQQLQSLTEANPPDAQRRRRLLMASWYLRFAIPTFLQLVPSRRQHGHVLSSLPQFNSWPEMVCSAELTAVCRGVCERSTTQHPNGQVVRDPLDDHAMDVDNLDATMREFERASGMQAVHQALLTGPLSTGERRFIDDVRSCGLSAISAAVITIYGYEDSDADETAVATVRDSAMQLVSTLITL